MRKSQPDGTQPLPDTAELGGEGGSFGDGAARRSRRTNGTGEARVDQVTSGVAGSATRFPDAKPEDGPSAGPNMKKHPADS